MRLRDRRRRSERLARNLRAIRKRLRQSHDHHNARLRVAMFLAEHHPRPIVPRAQVYLGGRPIGAPIALRPLNFARSV